MSFVLVRDRSRLGHKPDYRLGWSSEYVRKSMHAAVCLLRAGQPRSAGDAAKLGQFIGQFSWVTGDPIGVKGLITASCKNGNAQIRRRLGNLYRVFHRPPEFGYGIEILFAPLRLIYDPLLDGLVCWIRYNNKTRLTT